MSAVIVLDDGLVAAIENEIRQRAFQFPQSAAADILPEAFPDVVRGVAATINLDFEDRDAALWAALGRWKVKNPKQFIRRRPTPGRLAMAQFFEKKTHD